MKIVASLLLTAFISYTSFAQRFGLQAGTTFSFISSKNFDDSKSSKLKTGFTSGIFYDLTIVESFSLRMGLNFTQKGGQDKGSTLGTSWKSSETYNYLELPVNCIYAVSAGDGSFLIGVGPSVNFAIGGKRKYEENGIKQESDIKFGSDKNRDDYKAFDLAGNFIIGYQLSNGIFITTSYSKGVINMLLDGTSDHKQTNQFFGIRLGYLFGSDEE